ncbi:uncharacterized protein LOC114666040 [Erpetoichthys calabaricus]|uniref:uncharacterized protein LOC114666040 n=1 Tax=Erpetoichthys calabaricus TaxID=27687 RepID=UPI0022343B9F|nr:uncharacterized protein LOC114666040 [Erpetoichthys calabaricus]
MGLELLKRPALPLPSITFVMRHLSISAAAILALAALATLPPLTDARLVPKCELFDNLMVHWGSQQGKMLQDIIAKVICFVKNKSGFNTNAVTPVHALGEQRPKPQPDSNEIYVVEERQWHGHRAKRSREDSNPRDNSESSGMESNENEFQPNRGDREHGPPSGHGGKENKRRQKRSMSNSEEGDASGMGSPEKHEDASKGQKSKPDKGDRRKRPRRSISSEDVMESSGMPPEDHSVQTPRLLGIFQIDSQLACGDGKPDGVCHLKCEQLLDDNIQDDITCLKIISKDKWPEMPFAQECHTVSWSSLLSECK